MRAANLAREGAGGGKFLTRGAFLASAGGAALAAVGYAWWIEPHWLEITRRDLAVENLPSALEGRTIAHLSDLHIGAQVDDAYVAETFARVAALRPDLMVHTGDLVSYDGDSCLARARRLLAGLPSAPLGSFAVLGNHDYGASWSRSEVARAVQRVWESVGFRVLRNESVDVGGLALIGLDDLWSGRFDLGQAMSGHSPERPALALCHNPDACDLPGWGNFRGWILAGHTHGGQVKPPFLPPPLLPVRNRRYTSGTFELSGGRQLYLSRGVGHLLRARFSVRPEVALLTLRRARAGGTGGDVHPR